MSAEELAWLAALVEGEGTFGRTGRPGGQVRVVMTDQDIIQRLHAVTALGLVHNRGTRSVHHKEAWEWAVTRRESVRDLVERLAPLLLERRRRQVGFIFQAAGCAIPAPGSLQPGSPAAWAWVAGLIEGEGHIAPGPSTRDQRPRITVEMTDFDTIERLLALTSVGTVIEIPPRREREQALRRWAVSRREDVRVVIQSTLPHLGERRRERALYALTRSLQRLLPDPMRIGRRWQRMERTMPSAFRRPYAFQAQPVPWPVHPPWQKAEHSKPTVLPAHPLATEPSASVWFTFRTEPRTRTANLPALNGTPLSSWASSACE